MTRQVVLSEVSPTAERLPDRRTGKRAVHGVGGVVLAAHGLVHLMGAGQLRYADADPAPGSAAGVAVGMVWLAAALLFLLAAVLLVRRRPEWRSAAVLGVVASVPVLLPVAATAGAGLVVDGAILAAVWASSGPAVGPLGRVRR